MPELTPTKVTASNLLATLYVYARQMKLTDEEHQRTKADQNIETAREEYIGDIWGKKLGQVFTSDFDIDTYRQLLLELVNIALTDSTRQNIKNTFLAYFPTIETEEIIPDEVYVYAGDKVLARQPILSITKVEVDSGGGYEERPTTDYTLSKDTNPATAQTENAMDMLKFVANAPTPGDSVRVTYVIDTLNIAIIDYWKNPEMFIGYSPSSTFQFRGALTIVDNGTASIGTSDVTIEDSTQTWNVDEWKDKYCNIPGRGIAVIDSNDADTLTLVAPGITGAISGDAYDIVEGYEPIAGNVWNNPGVFWYPDLRNLAYFLFGVQIQIRGVDAGSSGLIEKYVIPALETFVKPAGIYYRIVVTDIDLLASRKTKSASTRAVAVATSILGFGVQPFGSPTPVNPNDLGFGSPSLPEYTT